MLRVFKNLAEANVTLAGLWWVSTAIHLVLIACSCGVYRTINNMGLYFLCVVSYRCLTRGEKTLLFFLGGCNISGRLG